MESNDQNLLSLQERYSPLSICFGCGPKNLKGLRIRSFPIEFAAEEQTFELHANWRAEDHHEAFPGMLNGGIIGSLLDCHSNWTAAYVLMRVRKDSQPPCTVTSEFSVKLLRPTPSREEILLIAKAVNMPDLKDDRVVVEATLKAGGKNCATCRGVFVAVKPGHPAYHRW